MPARRESKPDDHRELVRGIEALHALMGDLDAYLDAALRVLPEVGRVENPEGRRLFGFVFLYVENAHAYAHRAVDGVRRLAELAIKAPLRKNGDSRRRAR